MRFYFTNNYEFIKDIINEAKEFIRIVAFQFTNKEFIDILIEKANLGIKVEIITLPEDSYKKSDERKIITDYYKSLKENKIEIFLCDWEVGDPSLTSTSMSGDIKEGGGDKWYSLHGKLLLTEDKVVFMSMNFIDKKLYDAYLILEKQEKIDKFLAKYKKIKKIFIERSSYPGIEGGLFDLLGEEYQSFIKANNRKIVKQYPPNLSPIIPVNTGLYISPFEGRLRDILYELIFESKEFLYIVSERLFDDDFIKTISNKMINSPKLELKLLTGPPGLVRQKPAKAREQFRRIKVINGEIRSTKDIHAKFWLNENYLIITSANLTQMNLGIKKSNNYWRANTEFCYIENDKDLIELAKKEFLKIFNKADNFEEVLTETNRALRNAKDYFDLYEQSSSNEAKKILAKFRLVFNIDVEKNIIRIVKYASMLAFDNKTNKKKKIEKEHVIMGGILLILQKRASTEKEIKENLSDVCNNSEIEQGINSLKKRDLIILEKEYYKINIEPLINKPKMVQKRLKF